MKQLSFLFLAFFLLGRISSINASDNFSNELEERNNTTPAHQPLETFLGKYKDVVHEDLWPFFKKSWSAIFNGYERLLEQNSSDAKRLTPEKEEKHTECLLVTLTNLKKDCSMQFFTIITRLNSPTHLRCLSQDPFFDED